MVRKVNNTMWSVFSKYIAQFLFKNLKIPLGISNWLATFLLEKIGTPIVKWIKIKIEKYFKKKEVNSKTSKVKESKNEEDFNNSFDDLP